METKKDSSQRSWAKKIVSNKKYGLNFNIGLVIALAFAISAFEWKSYGDIDIIDLTANPDTPDNEEMPITIQDPPPPPPPKKEVLVKLVEVEKDDLADDLKDLLDKPINPNDAIPESITDLPPEESVETIHYIVENMPEFKGGLEAFYKYLSKEIKYPTQARKMGVEGKVFVEFVINTDGELTDIKIIKGIGAGCDQEALRVIQSCPAWVPGKQRGVPVNVKKVIPINFQLH